MNSWLSPSARTASVRIRTLAPATLPMPKHRRRSALDSDRRPTTPDFQTPAGNPWRIDRHCPSDRIALCDAGLHVTAVAASPPQRVLTAGISGLRPSVRIGQGSLRALDLPGLRSRWRQRGCISAPPGSVRAFSSASRCQCETPPLLANCPNSDTVTSPERRSDKRRLLMPVFRAVISACGQNGRRACHPGGHDDQCRTTGAGSSAPGAYRCSRASVFTQQRQQRC